MPLPVSTRVAVPPPAPDPTTTTSYTSGLLLICAMLIISTQLDRAVAGGAGKLAGEYFFSDVEMDDFSRDSLPDRFERDQSL